MGNYLGYTEKIIFDALDKSFYFESTGNVLIPLLDFIQHRENSNVIIHYHFLNCKGELSFEDHFFSLAIKDDYEENEPVILEFKIS